MNERKAIMMEQFLKGEITVLDLIERCLEFEDKVNELCEKVYSDI